MELIIEDNFNIEHIKSIFNSNIDTIIFNENENNFPKIKKLGNYFYFINPNIKIIINTIGYNLYNFIDQKWIYKIYINRVHFLEYINDKHYNNFLIGFDDVYLFPNKEKISFRLHLSKNIIYKSEDIEHFLKLSLIINIFNVEIINNNFMFNFSKNVIRYKNNEYIYKNSKISKDLLFFTIL